MISEEKKEAEDIDDYNITNQWYQAQEIPREYKPVEKYTAKTLGWMFLGLMTTFLVSTAGCTTGAIIYVFIVPYTTPALTIAEVAVVPFLSARINKMPVGAVGGLFFLYAVLNDIIFPAHFLMYNILDTVVVFAVTSAFFGVVVAVGYVMKADLSKLHNFLVSGLILLVAFWLFGMFVNLAQFEVIICTVGVFIFLLFAVYDTQEIRAYYVAHDSNPEMVKKASIFSVLQLYLDSVNLFLYLLHVLGRRK